MSSKQHGKDYAIFQVCRAQARKRLFCFLGTPLPRQAALHAITKVQWPLLNPSLPLPWVHTGCLQLRAILSPQHLVEIVPLQVGRERVEGEAHHDVVVQGAPVRPGLKLTNGKSRTLAPIASNPCRTQ